MCSLNNGLVSKLPPLRRVYQAYDKLLRAALTREDRAFQIRWEEYKMIQDKIDKIGAFRFRLRGWLITLMTAVATAAFSTNKLTYVVFIQNGIAVPVTPRLDTEWIQGIENAEVCRLASSLGCDPEQLMVSGRHRFYSSRPR